ncbi:hypothetical protein PCASD_00814 [Puccinia coronata f. sp. avenae]|uniref:DNA 3'-5' helicase n=1 Tax=Puccinia coronata f. sp. avenae TaxID=200324 RepID=A0A2N5VPG9_9BASI|nr:hypothetical protein PCASD_00814 [Puccinia coronata f. sp. avenae]
MYPPLLRQAVFSKKRRSTSRRPAGLATGQSGISVAKKLLLMTDEQMKSEIQARAREFYNGVEARPLQVNVVANLVKGCNTFLLAGTGYGKSRIAELYHQTLPKNRKGVVLVINPLDALGNNQVKEKHGTFSAINLTKLTFNAQVACQIQHGEYNFVYLSPKIFMNNKVWDQVYFSSEFQERLSLVVVDKAHMIYVWGMVDSSHGNSRSVATVVRHEDAGEFRLSYGKIGIYLQFRTKAPLLLLSATCQPVAVEGIMKCLKVSEKSLDILCGELTRPEICIIRVPMINSLASNLDLLSVFPKQDKMADSEIIPTLIYSGTRARTYTVLEVFDLARDTLGSCCVPYNTFARRYHSVTGGKDKQATVQEYADGKFPVISATMALGLGKNWKRVRCVIHMGRGDPANISQMIGRRVLSITL